MKKSNFIGPLPGEIDKNGRPAVRIGTVYPNKRTVVTLPVIHLFQRMAYAEWLEKHFRDVMSAEEIAAEKDEAVDFICEGDKVLIRPDPNNMSLAFRGDEILSEVFGRRRVQFLFIQDERVRTAIKQRGECWRINPLPQSRQDMRAVIRRSRMAMGGHQIYYYSNETGTRFLTFQNFARLATLPNDELLAHLLEIAVLAARAPNRLGNPEIEFFLADNRLTRRDFAEANFALLDNQQLREAYLTLREQFRAAVPSEYQYDDIGQAEWRSRMFSALIGRKNDPVPEDDLFGLSPEFFLQVEWLAGGRFENGGLILDPITQKAAAGGETTPEEMATFEKVRAFIINFIREYGDLEYVNVGRVVGSLSNREKRRLTHGRREVYVAEIQCSNQPQPVIRMIRMQKHGVWEKLREGKDLARAMIESEDYSDYVMDRRLGCRQLGMNLTQRMTLARITETYHPNPADPYTGSYTIWSPYFERDYVHGMATDKIPRNRYKNPEYALALARCLGAAAAPNMIIGRCDLDRQVVFDDGDELVVEDDRGIPVDIVMSDQMGSFRDYSRDLIEVVGAYAQSVVSRKSWLADPGAFAEVYVDAFLERFQQVQNMYRSRRNAFDSLFSHRRFDPRGSFAYRWEQVLRRLDRSDPRELAEGIRDALACELDGDDEPSGIGPECRCGPV